MQGVGYSVSLGGFFLYNYIKMNPIKVPEEKVSASPLPTSLPMEFAHVVFCLVCWTWENIRYSHCGVLLLREDCSVGVTSHFSRAGKFLHLMCVW